MPEKYPTVCDPDSLEVPLVHEIGAFFVSPVRQNFQWLTKAVMLAAHNVTTGVWNKGVMEAYLRTCAVAGSV